MAFSGHKHLHTRPVVVSPLADQMSLAAVVVE